MTLTGIILYSLFFGFLTAFLAERRGYNSRAWFWLGVWLGVIATAILLLQPNKKKGNADVSDTVSK